MCWSGMDQKRNVLFVTFLTDFRGLLKSGLSERTSSIVLEQVLQRRIHDISVGKVMVLIVAAWQHFAGSGDHTA